MEEGLSDRPQGVLNTGKGSEANQVFCWHILVLINYDTMHLRVKLV